MHHYQVKSAVSQAMLKALLQSAFVGIAQVHFVQIGANDGQSDDFIFPLATTEGWTGAVIEPVPHIFEKLEVNYRPFPSIRPFRIVVGTSDGYVPFYHFAPAPGELVEFLGSLERDVILRHAPLVPDIDKGIVETELEAVSISRIVEYCGLAGIDLLVTDVEGADAKLVKAFNFTKHMPRVIVMEHKHIGYFDLLSLDEFLEGYGYSIIRLFEDTVYVRLGDVSERHVQKFIASTGNAAKKMFS